jgi:predicted dehydrogenase
MSPLITSVVPSEQAEAAYQQLAEGAGQSLATLIRYDAPRVPSHTITTSTRTLESDRIRVALIGAGNFAKGTHLPLLKELGDMFALQMVVDRDGVNARETARKSGAKEAGTDYEAALQSSQTDAIIVTTRHHLHGEIVLQGLRANKHVFVEKPLALTEEELAAIEEFYADGTEDKPMLLVGFNRRFSPIMLRLKEAVSGRNSPMIINYRMNAGYQPPDSWLHGPEGGGRNRGEACHIYDLFGFLSEARAVEVDYSEIRPNTEYYRADDNFVCTVRMEDGSVGSLTYTSLGSRNFPKEQMDLFCDGWTASMNDYRTLRFFGVNRSSVEGRTTEKGHRNELCSFGKAIRERGTWPIPLWQMAQATRISHAGSKR